MKTSLIFSFLFAAPCWAKDVTTYDVVIRDELGNDITKRTPEEKKFHELSVGSTPYMKLTKPDTKSPAWEPEPTPSPPVIELECVEDDGLHALEGFPKDVNLIFPKIPCKEGEIFYPKGAKKPHKHEWEKSEYMLRKDETTPNGWTWVKLETCSCGLLRLPPDDGKK